jgi:cell division protease FtsH
VFLGRDFSTRQNYSEEVASEVDHEIRSLLSQCYDETREMLKANDAAFERVAQALLLVETLDGEQFERLFTGEATPEMIKDEFDHELRDIERRNKEEAEEARRIAQAEQEEQRRRMQEELEKLKAAADEKHDREVVSFDNDDKDQN